MPKSPQHEENAANALRAVVDTNVLVSALINPEGPPAAVVDAIRELQLTPVVSAEVLAEYDEVLHRPRLRLPVTDVEELLANMRALALLVEVPLDPPDIPLPDPDDWPFIAAARAALCPIVTGNARHFPAHAEVEVVTPAEFLARFMA